MEKAEEEEEGILKGTESLSNSFQGFTPWIAELQSCNFSGVIQRFTTTRAIVRTSVILLYFSIVS